MQIDTAAIQEITVEIEGSTYEVAPKTLERCEKFNGIIDNAIKTSKGIISPEKMMEAIEIF